MKSILFVAVISSLLGLMISTQHSNTQYVDHGNGTVTDANTGLMWKQCSEGQTGKSCSGQAAKYTWDDAMGNFNKSDIYFAGYNDWRMPTHEELRSLVWCSNMTRQEEAWSDWCDGKNSNSGEYQHPTIDLKSFPNTDEWFYWSSTEKDTLYAWLVYFDSGYDNWNGRGYEGAIRLVRTMK